jgi:hypothetical protein
MDRDEYCGIDGPAWEGDQELEGYFLPNNVRPIVETLIDLELRGGRNDNQINNTLQQLQNTVGNMSNADRAKLQRAIMLMQGTRDDRRLPPPGFVDVLERVRVALEPNPNNMQLNGGRKLKQRRHRKTKKHSRRNMRTKRRAITRRR